MRSAGKRERPGCDHAVLGQDGVRLRCRVGDRRRRVAREHASADSRHRPVTIAIFRLSYCKCRLIAALTSSSVSSSIMRRKRARWPSPSSRRSGRPSRSRAARPSSRRSAASTSCRNVRVSSNCSRVMPLSTSSCSSRSAARSANGACALGSVRIQTSNELPAARHVDGRHGALAAFRERLDVRVVAVVQAAQLADHVEQMARLIAVLAEPRVRDPQRIEVALAAAHVERKAEADRGIGARLVDEQRGAAVDRLRRRSPAAPRRSRPATAARPLGAVRRPPASKPPPTPSSDVRARVVAAIERAHVVERDRRASPRPCLRSGARSGVPRNTRSCSAALPSSSSDE